MIVPAPGDGLQDVPPGGTVFIGEENLNLTEIPPGTTLTWYTGDQVVGRSAPAATITIGNNASFYVAPSEFSRRTGNWYIGNSEQVGFVVSDPAQTISVYNQASLTDITNKSAREGEYLTFRVETNMNVVPEQRPGETGFLTIRVRAPDGMVYTQLCQDETTVLNLVGLAPDAMPWYWVPLKEGSEEGWSTGLLTPEENRVYPPGDYFFWTESGLNGMKENYKGASGDDFTGKTVSAVHSISITSDSVHIEVSNESVVQGDSFTVTITGKPDNAYYLWVEDTNSLSGLPGYQPPSIILSQDGVRMDQKNGPWPIGQYVFQGSTKTIQQNVAQHYGFENVKGVVYYASVTLDRNGNRTIGFLTTPGTKDQDYTIRVERPEPYDPPESDTGPERKFKMGEVDVTVEKGTVGVDDPSLPLRNAPIYFLGEEITLSGSSSGSNFTYLFITGPNLPANGGQMTAPLYPVDVIDLGSFARAEVINKEWEYKWQTANLDIDTGTYTIYAVAAPFDKRFLSSTQYGTVSVIIKKPFISARATPPVVASGDKLVIRGIAAGQPEEGIGIWILGKNKFLYRNPGVNPDGTFELELSNGQTADMAAGQYFAVVQHPMYNEIFDVSPASSVAGYNNMDLVAGSYPVPGNTLFRLEGEGSLDGPDAADALVQALNNPSVDDIYAKLQFVVEVPAITVLPVDEKQVGDLFPVAGTTNLAAGDQVLVEIISSSFKPTTKIQEGEFYGVSGIATVLKGTDERNRWSFPVSTAKFRPDDYIVQVSGVTVNAQASTLFTLVPYNPATHRTIVPSDEDRDEPVSATIETAPDETPPGEEEGVTGSGDVTIGAKASKQAITIDENPTPGASAVVTSVPVVNEPDEPTTTIPARATVPTTRPTIQPGFGIFSAMIGLVVVALHIIRKQ
ncbi:MAG: DUF3821 domain-containing protein [Methanoregulaceae archaeon]|jgi:hypothetical protein|nr:DUF3821 domain-containing protein [Methanoregulaceae archaeon]